MCRSCREGNTTQSADQQPVIVQQSSAAILESVLGCHSGWWAVCCLWSRHHDHGIGAPGRSESQDSALKAFTSDGTGYLSNIVAALYYAVQHQANVVNMSFDVSSPSSALSQAVCILRTRRAWFWWRQREMRTPAQLSILLQLIRQRNGHRFDHRLGPALFLFELRRDRRVDCRPRRVRHQHLPWRDVRERVRHVRSVRHWLQAARRCFLQAKTSLHQADAANDFSHAIRLTPDLNHGRHGRLSGAFGVV